MPPVLWATSSDSGGRSDPDLHVPLPCLPASDWKRLRDPGTVHIESSARRRSLQRLRANFRRGRGENLSFLPRLRRDGLLHAFESARCCCRSDRRIRRADLPATDSFGLRVPTASVASYACRDGTLRMKVKWLDGRRLLCKGWPGRG